MGLGQPYNPEYQRQYYLKNKEKKLAYQKEYANKNAEHINKKARERAKANKEQRKLYIKEWYLKNRQKHIDSVNEWRKNNPDKARQNSRKYVINRRARQAIAPGIFEYSIWIQKIEYHGWKCFYCKKPLNEDTLTIDHRKPLAKGGSNWIANLVPSCKPCNCGKGDKYGG